MSATSVTTPVINAASTETTTKKRRFNFQEAKEQGLLLKEAKNNDVAAYRDECTYTASGRLINASGKVKSEAKLNYIVLINEELEPVVVGVGGQTVSIAGALSGNNPYNANSKVTDNPVVADYNRSNAVLECQVKIGDKWIKEHYPGGPSLNNILESSSIAIGEYHGWSFSIIPILAQTDPAIKKTWIDRVAALKTMVLACEHTIRVETAATRIYGRNHATWTEIDITDDASVAYMLYREWTWTITGTAPNSAHPVEIAAREAAEFAAALNRK